MAAALPTDNEAFDDLIACPGCDLLLRRRQLAVGEYARCSRCNDVVQTRKPHTVDRTLGATLAGIVLLLMSLFAPFLSLTRAGIESRISVMDAVRALWNSELRWLGFVTVALIVLLPMARLLLMGYVLIRLRLQREVRKTMRTAFRWSLKIEPWAMDDIFIIGVVVSLVKISSLASLSVGIAFWSLVVLVAVSLVINVTLCKDTIWARLNQRR